MGSKFVLKPSNMNGVVGLNENSLFIVIFSLLNQNVLLSNSC